MSRLYKARRPRVSIDAVVTFKHQGESVVATVQRTQFLGGTQMRYFWKTEDGRVIQTEGVPKDMKVLADPARIVRRALQERMAARLASRPVVFLDFDDTLAHSQNGGAEELRATFERATRLYERKPNPITKRMVDKAQADLDRLPEIPEIEFSDGTVMTVHPRPGLHQFLGALQSMATLYVLSHGTPAYLEKAISALGIEGHFKGIISTKGGAGLPRNLPDRWVLVDDMSPGSSGIKIKLTMLGDTDPLRHVQIKPYQGGADSALSGVVSEVRDRLQS